VTIDEAFQILCLKPGALPDQIEEAYIRLSPKAHPDTGGSDEAFILLTKARDTAMGTPPSSAMIPVETVRDLIALVREDRKDQERKQEQERKREEARIESRRVSTSIVMTQTRKYRELRRQAAVLSAIGLALTVLQVSTIPKLSSILPDSGVVTVFLAFVSIWFGVRAWVNTTIAEDLRGSIEDFTERLSDKGYYLDTVYNTIPDTDKPFFTDWDWYRGIRNWVEHTEMNYEQYEDEERSPSRLRLRVDKIVYRLSLWTWRYRIIRLYRFLFRYRLKMPHEVARIIGYSDFRRLLVAKGTELELIETREVRLNNWRQIVYAPVPFSDSASEDRQIHD
jgi:hypothetical protein